MTQELWYLYQAKPSYCFKYHVALSQFYPSGRWAIALTHCKKHSNILRSFSSRWGKDRRHGLLCGLKKTLYNLLLSQEGQNSRLKVTERLEKVLPLSQAASNPFPAVHCHGIAASLHLGHIAHPSPALFKCPLFSKVAFPLRELCQDEQRIKPSPVPNLAEELWVTSQFHPACMYV